MSRNALRDTPKNGCEGDYGSMRATKKRFLTLSSHKLSREKFSKPTARQKYVFSLEI